ncbi:MAG: SdrD B-like domain-containing protein, partial [Desulfurococcaceae archaeon]
MTRPDNVKDSWTVISSNNGSFVAEYCLDGITGSYLVEATDGVSSASTIFTDTADWTTELLGWDMVSKTWVSGNLAGYSEGDLVGFKFIITNNQNVPSVPPQVNSFYDYFSVGNNAVGIDAEILWQYNYGKRSEIDFSTRFPPTSYMSILPNIENQFYKYQGGVRQNYYQFDAGRFPALKPKESLIIYFQAHLAETAYWKTVLDAIDPDLSPNKPDPVPGPHYGASYFPGASLQVGLALVYTGTKTETQSIPVSYAPGAISGYKFNDLNGDGIWDAGEPGLANWTIILDGYDAVGHHIVSQINTTSSGSYAFTGLPLGTYNITEILKAGWMQTHPSTGFHYNVTITEENRVITGKNFGNLQPGKTSGFKFNDLNGDGIWDAGEPALQGWNITLTGAANK